MSTQFSTKTAQGKTKILVLIAVVLGIAGLLMTPTQTANASHQSEGVWTHAVNACAIDEADLGEFAFNVNRLNHKAGFVGPLTARCNVENLPITPSGDATALILTYRDQDGPGTAYRVIARLREINNSGAVVTLAIVDSNTGPASPSFQSQFATFSHDFDFNNNAYYVEVTVFRKDALQAPAATIVRITGILL